MTAVSPVRENRTPTLHVSDKDAALLTIDTPFTEKSGMGLTVSNTRSISHYWEIAFDRRDLRRPTQGTAVQFDRGKALTQRLRLTPFSKRMKVSVVAPAMPMSVCDIVRR